MNASRYVDMTGVLSNRISLFSPRSLTDFSGILERAVRSFGTQSVTSNVALSAGSSQQGRARRASVGSNCVTAPNLSSPAGVVYFDLKI